MQATVVVFSTKVLGETERERALFLSGARAVVERETCFSLRVCAVFDRQNRGNAALERCRQTSPKRRGRNEAAVIKSLKNLGRGETGNANERQVIADLKIDEKYNRKLLPRTVKADRYRDYLNSVRICAYISFSSLSGHGFCFHPSCPPSICWEISEKKIFPNG